MAPQGAPERYAETVDTSMSKAIAALVRLGLVGELKHAEDTVGTAARRAGRYPSSFPMAGHAARGTRL
jgi:hypothetical protein